VERAEDSPCQYLSTVGGWDDYYRGRFNSKRRRDQRREWRLLEETGALSQELVTDVNAHPGLADAFAEVQAAHVDAGEARPGEFNNPRFRAFLEEMLAVGSARGWLRMPILWRDGAPIAYYIAFLYQGRYCVYNTSHRADCQAYGAGKLLMVFMLERFFNDGGEVIDYLRGAEAYKSTWTEGSVSNTRLRAARPGLARAIWFKWMPAAERRAPLLFRALTVASDEGVSGVLARLRRRAR
jgi:CelD/BcsL family acetyltransferase involved in cellulose biosynthesis